MKFLWACLLVFLISCNASALTITNQWRNLVKFDIKLHVNETRANVIFKQVNRKDSIAMPGLLGAYAGDLFSVVIHDYDYSATTFTCIDRLPRNDALEVIYLGAGKCKVKG